MLWVCPFNVGVSVQCGRVCSVWVCLFSVGVCMYIESIRSIMKLDIYLFKCHIPIP